MWYWGGSVSHKSIQKQIQKFCDNRWLEELNDIRELFTTDGSPEQPADNGKETAAPKDGPIEPNCEDDEQVLEGGLESESIEMLLQYITMVYNKFELSHTSRWQCSHLYDVAMSCNELPDFGLVVIK